MEMEEQMKRAEFVLGCIQVFWPEAVIAGGAPRDWYFNRVAKDIDIYLQADSQDIDVAELGIMFSGCVIRKLGNSYSEAEDDNFIKYVYEVEGFMGLDLQFIFCDFKLNPEKSVHQQVVDQFDAGICMITWDGQGPFNADPKFHRDEEDKTITIHEGGCTTAQLKRSVEKHLPKLRSYFPDYKVIIPPKVKERLA